MTQTMNNITHHFVIYKHQIMYNAEHLTLPVNIVNIIHEMYILYLSYLFIFTHVKVVMLCHAIIIKRYL